MIRSRARSVPPVSALRRAGRGVAFLVAVAAIVSGAALAVPSSAKAGAEPDVAKVVQAQVLPGWRTARGTRMVALKLTLAPGWHTYWRAPGEAGIPPRFDWSGSKNLASVKISWPQPRVFDLNGMRSIGYTDTLVLPVELTPDDPAGPVHLTAAIDLGVCHDICMPAALVVTADLTGKGTPDPAISAALAAQPVVARTAGLTAAHCTAIPLADGIRLTAELTLPSQGGDETAVFELPDPEIWVSEARTRRSGNRLTATADLVPSDGKPFALDRSALTITVLGAKGAVELQGCPGA